MIPVPTDSHVLLRQDEDGAIRIGDTRVLLEIVVELFLEGNSPESICCRFRALSLADAYQVIGHYLRNREAVDAYMTWVNEEAKSLREKLEGDSPNKRGLKKALLERLAERKSGYVA